MSTKLNSRIIRETSETVDGSPLLIELNKDQTIVVRLKGSRKHLQIGVKTLYDYLSGKGSVVAGKKERGDSKGVVVSESDMLIPLSRLRSFNNVTPSPTAVTTKVNELLNDLKEEFTQQQNFKNKKA